MALRGEFWWVYPAGRELYWARRVAGEDIPREEGTCDGPEGLPAPEGARLVLCVPGLSVRTHQVDLPARSRRKFLAALPFALEDQLLHEPEAYHFLPLPGDPDRSRTPVAVVEHARMQEWLAPFQERGWRIRMLLPDYLALPAPRPGLWMVDVSDSPFLVRRPAGQGGVAISGGLGEKPPGALLLALEGADPRPETLRIRVAGAAEREKVRAWSQWLEPYGVGLEVQEDSRGRPVWLARHPLPSPKYSLLSGPYASREDPRVLARRLAPAGALVAALLLTLATQWLLEGGRLRAEHAQLRRAIEETYREAFPDARNIVDARYQMEKRLERLRGSRDEDPETSGFLPLLQRLAPEVRQRLPEARLVSLAFEGGSLTVEVIVADYERLERLKKILARHGEVRVQNAELKDGKVRGRVQIAEAG